MDDNFLISCMECGHVCDYKNQKKCKNCNSEWIDATYNLPPKNNNKPLISNISSMWRYKRLLPIKNVNNIVTLDEGWTPILRLNYLEKQLGLKKILVKDERKNPTSTFKDRQASMIISNLKNINIGKLVACSTGNVAVSYAAYCAKANIKFSAFLPDGVSDNKIKKIINYGSEVHNVSGNYDEAKKIAKNYAIKNNIYYDEGTSLLYNREAKKTIAYEIAEQLEWKVPDWYIQAVSGGSGPMGVWKGFKELQSIGLIKKIPKIACVQANGCSPMVDSFINNLKKATPVVPSTSIITLSTGDPGMSYIFLRKYITETGGTMVKVTEDTAEKIADYLIEKEDLYMCHAAATAFGGLYKLSKDGIISKDSTVIVNCSGGNL